MITAGRSKEGPRLRSMSSKKGEINLVQADPKPANYPRALPTLIAAATAHCQVFDHRKYLCLVKT